MSAVDILFMGLVVAVAILMAVLKSKIPYWLGFVLMIVAGSVTIVGGAVTHEYKAIPLGVAAVVGTIVVWISGATSSPASSTDSCGGDSRRDDPDTLGGIASRVRWYAWLIVVALVAGGVAVGFALPR